MSGRREVGRIIDLENLTSDEAFTLVSEIPSDNESVTSGAPSDDELEENFVENSQCHDYVPICDEFVDVLHDNERQYATVDDFDSEDDLPLAVFKRMDFQWTQNMEYATIAGTFQENCGPNVPDDIQSPTEVFLCMFTKQLIEKLVFETNLYATQKHGTRYDPTTYDEMKSFIGINFMMGITKKPSYKDYWSSKMELRDPFISSVMSRDRFAWLLGHIHINDNSVQPKKGELGYDKLYKLRPLLDILTNTFLACFKPNENQSIDESMVKFKGRVAFRQYMPLKPIKRGYKIWIRADQSSYVSQFQIYTGKTESAETKLDARVVKDLTRELVDKNHKIYFDNYFSSIELMGDLLKEKIYACATVRKGRKLEPKDLHADKLMKRGDYDWRLSNTGLLYLKWMDNKSVRFVSNFHSPTDTQLVERTQKDGSRKQIPSLQLVKDYNKHMGYVDKSDMYISLYKVNRKSKKWWHRLLWHFVDLSLVNSFIIFSSRSKGIKSIKLKEFRLAVACGLIGATSETSKRGRRSGERPESRFKVNVPIEKRLDKYAHMPIHGNKVRCAHCSTRAEPHRTRWHCSTCSVGLCLTEKLNCFVQFHKM